MIYIFLYDGNNQTKNKLSRLDTYLCLITSTVILKQVGLTIVRENHIFIPINIFQKRCREDRQQISLRLSSLK